MLFNYQCPCTINQPFVHSNSFRNGKCVGTAGLAGNKFIQGQQIVFVKRHGAINYAGCFVCHDFQIQVMGGYNSIGMPLCHFFQDHLRKCATKIGIASAAELVNEK
jgi:hypothetical protein